MLIFKGTLFCDMPHIVLRVKRHTPEISLIFTHLEAGDKVLP